MICPHCGEEAMLDVLDVYVAERSFMLEVCCETAERLALEELAEDPRAFGRFIEERAGVPCVAVAPDLDAAGYYGNGGLVLDFGLAVGAICWSEAVQWIGAHHRHNRTLAGWRWGHAVANGPERVAVATVGRPVSRMLDADAIVEVTRVCVDPGLPALVARNACSMLYGAAAREARSRGFQRAITYTREGELATTVQAAGWTATHVTKVDRRGWSRAARPRAGESRCRKLRWERGLTRDAQRDVQSRALPPARVAELTGAAA